MNLYKRRLVAYIIGRLIGKKEISKVYDQTTSSYKEISGEVSVTKINVYDPEKNELITGSGDDKGISLYDFATTKFIDLKIYKDTFEGFDYKSKKIFFGDMKGNKLTFFDLQDSKHHYYVMIRTDEDMADHTGLLI